MSYNIEQRNIHIIILRNKEKRKKKYIIYIFYEISLKNVYIFTLSKRLIFNHINDIIILG